MIFSEERTARRPHRCDECRAISPPKSRYVRTVYFSDGETSVWRHCLLCEALGAFAWSIVRRDGLHEDDGPRVGEVAVWLADYEHPEHLRDEMPADIAAHFAALLAKKSRGE